MYKKILKVYLVKENIMSEKKCKYTNETIYYFQKCLFYFISFFLYTKISV